MKRIMNVDDDPMIRNLVKTILEDAEYTVLSCESGEHAFEVLDEQPRPLEIDCFVLDVELPGMTGFDILTRLKLHADTQNIPVIMLTCQGTPEDMMNGYNIGAEYYITKPFTRDQLLYGIQMVERSDAAPAEGDDDDELSCI